MNPQDRVDAARRELRAVRDEVAQALQGNKTRARAPFVRLLHEVQGMLNHGYPFASQAGQDQVIDRLFKGRRDGTFVDIGAYDGVSGSNSLYFEKWRGWTGVLVEPVTAQADKARSLRTSPVLPYAVSDSAGQATFIAVTEGFTQMSGLSDTYDAGLLDRVRADPRHRETTLTVETRTIAGILEESGITNPDFVSLDIEGGELAALSVFPFAEHQVKAWAIENNSGGPEIAEIMRANGYRLIEFCGPDEIYATEDF